MVTTTGLAITFNGEIYNYRDLRRELESEGVVFESKTDTEVVLKGYERRGEAVLDDLVGMFAFAIWDSGRRQLFLARDRLGEKPLYYLSQLAWFAFASELGALTALDEAGAEIDRTALALYLQYQAVPAPLTIFKGIKKLPPGHAMIVRAGKLRTWRYWDPLRFAAMPRLEISRDNAREQLAVLLRDAVRGQMLADVPLGAFLSGGIDSSAVAILTFSGRLTC